ncbi:hypothetical protein B1207_02045 [Legionella quinlivanii]|uniref:Uncharacterized protein n=1 Tax=Legionella quinlivanii TaxID=45073 RepID=A0A364LLQ4_9GAMM|nr:hypothetical protein [Legionella quinlivanii]RAP37795.1 hypothetical protein B1207_02045 [Legionella quinlivanii]
MPNFNFQFEQYNNDFSKFLIACGVIPKLPPLPKYYTKAEVDLINKQFSKEFKQWWKKNQNSISIERYITIFKKNLSAILALPTEQRELILKKLKEVISHPQIIENIEKQLTKKLSWSQLYNYFHRIWPDSHISEDLVANSLSYFDEEIMQEALNIDLFNLSSIHRSFLSPINFIINNIQDALAKKLFCMKIIQNQVYWLEIMASMFSSTEIQFLKTNTHSRAPFADNIPGEYLIEKLLNEVNSNPVHYRKHIPVSFHERLKTCLQCNEAFTKFIAEQTILYFNLLKTKDKSSLYLPLKYMLEQFGLKRYFEELGNGKQQPLYIPLSALKIIQTDAQSALNPLAKPGD